MRTRLMWVLGLSVVTLSGLQACGSDSGGNTGDKEDGSAGKDGTGGRGGAGGASGGAGGSMLPCNTAPCDQQIAPLQGVLGMLGGGISLKACCLNATTCGIDTSGIGMLLGVQLPGCVDPSTLTTMPTPMGSGGSPSIPILDGGIIPVPGGQPIQLDKSCPDITTARFIMPGCCRPSGTCGGSSHTLIGAGTTVPLACVSYDDVAASATASFEAGVVVVPDDPNIHCDYTLGPPKVPEAGVDTTPESGPPAPAPDASPPGHPDAGAAVDAAAADAATD